MRVERTYYIGNHSGHTDPVRADVEIHQTETHFCEDPECERTHDDPSTLWDTKGTRVIAIAYGIDAAKRILAALEAVEVWERRR